MPDSSKDGSRRPDRGRGCAEYLLILVLIAILIAILTGGRIVFLPFFFVF